MSPTVQRRLKSSAKLGVLALVAWFVHGSLRDGWTKLQQQIDAGQWSPGALSWSWLAAAALLYTFGQLPYAVFWRQILDSLGQKLSLAVVLRAYYVGQLGKYVPGKAMVVVMRTGMLTPYGAQPAAAAVSVFYETLTMMAVGALVSAVIIAIKFSEHVDWLLASSAMVVVTGLPVLPAVFTRIVRKLRVGRSDEAAVSSEVGRMRTGQVAVGRLLVASGWFVSGLSIWATMRAAGFTSDVGFVNEWIICTAAAALSVVVGFLSLIPGGFFVREAVLLTFLQPTYGEAGALVAAVLVRLVWLVAELGVSVILYGYGIRRGERPATIADAPREPDDLASSPLDP